MGERLKEFALLAIVLLVGWVVGWLSCRYGAKEGDSCEVLTKVDTLFIRDTIIEIKPVPVETIVTDTMLVEIHDTTERVVYLLRESKMYSGENYKCAVSGYKPELDWIEVYPETHIVTNTIKEREKPKHWGIGVQVGYGATIVGSQVKFSPYIGVGVHYSIFSW